MSYSINENENSITYPNSLISISKDVCEYLKEKGYVHTKYLNERVISKIKHSEKISEKNIQRRGRTYELNISDDYLLQLNDNYLSYFKQLTAHRIIVINGSEFDIVNNHESKNKLIDLIQKDLLSSRSFFL